MVRCRDCHNDYNEPFLGVIRWRTNQPNLSGSKTHHSATWVSGYLIFILSQMFLQNSIIINQSDLHSCHHRKGLEEDQFMKFLVFTSWYCFTDAILFLFCSFCLFSWKCSFLPSSLMTPGRQLPADIVAGIPSLTTLFFIRPSSYQLQAMICCRPPPTD